MRDFPLSLAFVGIHWFWLTALSVAVGGAVAVWGAERPAARLWLTGPALIALVPLLSRRFGGWAVFAAAALVLLWSVRDRTHNHESVLVGSVTGTAIAVHLARFLIRDYAGRDTALWPLLTLALTTTLALAVFGLARSNRPLRIASTGGALGMTVAAAVLMLLVTAAGGESVPRRVSAEAVAAERPPVVLIVMDTVRADHLELYGYSRDTMPRLTALARTEAVVVERAISNAPDSLSAHASLFTGLYPVHHGAHRPLLADPRPPAFGYPLRDDVPTLAEVLHHHGYATLGVSANAGPVSSESGFGLERGFDVYRDHPNGECAFASPWEPLARAVNRWVAGARWLSGCPVPYRRAQEITDEAIALVDAAGGSSFFLFVNYMDAHRPYNPPGEFRHKFPGVDPDAPRLTIGTREVREILRGERDLPEERHAHLDALYDGELLYLDTHLARLLDRLRRHPSWAEMLLVITSDHGEALGEHRQLGHRSGREQHLRGRSPAAGRPLGSPDATGRRGAAGPGARRGPVGRHG